MSLAYRAGEVVVVGVEDLRRFLAALPHEKEFFDRLVNSADPQSSPILIWDALRRACKDPE